MLAWLPEQANTRLRVESGKRAMKKLCADGERQAIGNNREFILRESAVKLVRAPIRIEEIGGNDFRKVCRADARAQSPDDVIAVAQGNMVDQIEIVGITILALCRLNAVHAVVIHLHLQIGTAAEGVLPVRENVAAGEVGVLVQDGGERRRE